MTEADSRPQWEIAKERHQNAERAPGRTPGPNVGDEFQDGHRLRAYPLSGSSGFITGYKMLCDACSREHPSGQASQHWARPSDACESNNHHFNVSVHGVEEPTEYEQHHKNPDVVGWTKDNFGAGKDHTLCTSCAEDRRSSGKALSDDYYPLTKSRLMPTDDCSECGHSLHQGRKEATRKEAISDAEFEALTNLPTLDLARAPLGRCSRCGAPLGPGEDSLCPGCDAPGNTRKTRQRQKMVRTQGTERTAMTAPEHGPYYGQEGTYPPGGHIVRTEPGFRGAPREFHAENDPECSHQQESDWNADPGTECHGHHNPQHPLQAAIEKHQNYKGTRSHVPLMNNTWIHKDTEGAYHIRHHQTDILSVSPEGHTTINPDGWHSVTTMSRINSFLPSGVSLHRNRSRARNAPDRLLRLPNGESHAYEDGFSFNAHTSEVLPSDHVRPGTIERPPQARGTGQPRAPRPRPSRNYYDSGTSYAPSRSFTLNDLNDWTGNGGRPFGESSGAEPGAHYRPERDRQELEHADRRAPGADSYDSGHHYSPSSDLGYEERHHGITHDDLPQEGESFDDWVKRTTPAPKMNKCDSCRGRGQVRSGTGEDYKRTDCGTCKGSGYLRGDGTPAKVDERGHLSSLRVMAALEDRYQDGLRHQALRAMAFGETRAPVAVDTLRDANCPVCQETDSYDGDECKVCGFITPPAMFTDPDLDKARLLDLRNDPASGAPNNTDPNLPPVAPDAVAGDGTVLPGAEGEEAGQTADENGIVDVETRGLGDEPVDPTKVDEQGNVNDGQGGPIDLDPAGTPGDGQPDLLCPSCGFQADGAHPLTTPDSPALPADAGDGMLAGDVCPNCQKATLMSVGEVQEMQTAQQGVPIQ